MRRSRKAGSAPAGSRTPDARSGGRSRSRKGRPTRRPRPTARRSGRCWPERSRRAGARPRIRDPIGRPDVPRTGMRSRLVRLRTARSSSWCSACSRLTRPPRAIAFLLGEARGAVQAVGDQRAVRLYRRRLWRPRSHAVPALCRVGGDVFSRPPGAARAQPLPAVPGRHQAARVQDAHVDRRRSRQRQDRWPSLPTTSSTVAASRIIRPAWRRRRHRRARHLRRPEGRRNHRGAAFARRYCWVDARLRDAADDDRAGGAGR